MVANAPTFIAVDPEQTTRDLIALYEATTGRTLLPAQPERILIDLLAYRETLLRSAIQDVAEQNLVQWARSDKLDALGALLGVSRLAMVAATATALVTRTDTVGELIVPLGTEMVVDGTEVRFVTTVALTIPDASLTGTVVVTAVDPGIAANGWTAGTSLTLTAPIAGVESVVLDSMTMGGTDAEADDRFRQRILLAPESLSVAGPIGAYQFHARSAHADVIDVTVESPGPARVTVNVLTDTLPVVQAVLDAVTAAVGDDKVRPLTDEVTVQGAVSVSYTIDAQITVLENVIWPDVLAAATTAVDAVVATWQRVLGRDIVASELIAAIRAVSGVYDVIIVSPATTVLAKSQVAVLSGTPTITIVGEVEG